MRILVAEDDDILRQGLTQALTTAGYAAIATEDGSHADTLLPTEPFDRLVACQVRVGSRSSGP